MKQPAKAKMQPLSVQGHRFEQHFHSITNTLKQHPTGDQLNPGPVTASSSHINTIVITLQLAFIGIEVLAFNALR